jgi:hypothetical protein
MIVWLNAWPMCSVPVTLGGGSWMLNDGLAGSSVGAKASTLPSFGLHTGPHLASMAAGSKDLASSVVMGGRVKAQGP